MTRRVASAPGGILLPRKSYICAVFLRFARTRFLYSREDARVQCRLLLMRAVPNRAWTSQTLMPFALLYRNHNGASFSHRAFRRGFHNASLAIQLNHAAWHQTTETDGATNGRRHAHLWFAVAK